jgi:polar amino acid transport system substrate-binding protein
MRKLANLSVATVLAIVMASLGSAALAADVKTPQRIKDAGKLVFCTELAFPPWEMLDPQTQKPAGFDIDFAAAIAKRMGVSSEHKNIAFDGLIPGLQAGQCDAIISGLYDKPKRREVVDFVNYAFTGNSIFVKSSSDIKVGSFDELSGKKVSVGVGTGPEADLKDANERIKAAGKPEIRIISMPSTADAIQQLVAGLVDAYAGSTDQGGYFDKQQPGQIRLASPQVSALPVGIATLHKDKDLHEAFVVAVADVRQSGEYDALLKKWGLESIALKP